MSSDRQKNKPFKKPGNRASKSEQKNRAKGKIESHRESVKSTKQHSRSDRKNILKQQREKRKELLEKKRAGLADAPKIVAIVSLGGNVNQQEIRSALITAAESVDSVEDNAFAVIPVLAHKQRLTIIDTPRVSSAILDVAKIADVILFAVSAEEGTDNHGDHLISMIKAQGLPSVIGCLQNLNRIPEKNQHEVKKSFTKYFHFHFPGEPKMLPIHSQQDASQLLRFICNLPMKPPIWRQNRPYLLTQSCSYEADQEGKVTVLKLAGYLRGNSLSPNNLVHLPGYGDFQLKMIEIVTDPFPLKKKKVKPGKEMDATTGNTVLQNDPATRDDLEEENAVEEEEFQDDWSDTASMKSGKSGKHGTTKKTKKKPKGMSDYQAAWIVDEEGSGNDEDDEDDEEEGEENGDNVKMADDDNKEEEDDDESQEEEEEEEDDEEQEGDEDIEDVPMDEATYKKMKEEEDMRFPDEVDTPLDIPARIRFQKFRGLKSFRSSPWDPKENLPLDYARIFQFQNFTRAKRRILREQQDAPAKPGMYIILTIENAPFAKTFVDSFDPRSTVPIVASGLLKYEKKVSVIHFLVQKHPSYEESIPSKEELVLQCGFRTFRARPIYSQNSPNCDKHKYERFLHPGQSMIATVYSQITFPPAPVLVFKEDPADSEVLKLAATGSIHSINPDRIILKKSVLSASPFKIRKRTVVARHMFFNPDDVRWFKPIELHTKHGRMGHITEPLGTHGLMKCIFDGRLQPHDTVLMALYKRIYPKWRSAYYLPSSESTTTTTSSSSTSKSHDAEGTQRKEKVVKFKETTTKTSSVAEDAMEM